jgi:hypothetical protein
MTTKKKAKGVPGKILGIWEAQKLIANDTMFIANSWDIDPATGIIYSGGGTAGTSTNYDSASYKYDLKTISLSQAFSFGRYCSYPNVIFDNGKVYLVAGNLQSSSTQAYLNIRTLSPPALDQVSGLNYAYRHTRGFILNGVLHQIGGVVSTGGVTIGVYTYDLATGVVTSRGNGLSSAQYIQNTGRGVLYNGKYYFSRGGSTANNLLMVYDPATYKVTTLNTPPLSMAGESLALIGDNIYVRASVTQIGVYNIPAGTWSYLDAPNGPSTTSNGDCLWFFYDNSLWFKYTGTTNTDLRRFWRLY